MLRPSTHALVLRLLSLALCAVALLYATAGHADTTTKAIKVGVIAPFTGPVALLGVSVRNSLLLAAEREDVKSKIEFIFEDDQFVPRNGVAAAEKLIHQDKVKALIVFGSGTTLAIGNMVDASEVPTLAMAYSDKVFTGRRFVRRFFNTAAQSAELTAKELFERKYTSLAIVTTINETTVAVRDEFLKRWAGQTKVVVDLNPTDTDLNTTALKIKTANPSAVYVISGPPQLSLLPVALRGVSYKGDFITPSYGRNQSAIKAANGALNGALVIATFSEGLDRLVRECKQRFGSDVSEDGVIAHDLALFLTKAFEGQDPLGYLDSQNSLSGEVGVWQRLDSYTFAPSLAVGRVLGDEVVKSQ